MEVIGFAVNVKGDLGASHRKNIDIAVEFSHHAVEGFDVAVHSPPLGTNFDAPKLNFDCFVTTRTTERH